MLRENLHPINQAAARTLKRMGRSVSTDKMAILELLQVSREKGWVDLDSSEGRQQMSLMLDALQETVEVGEAEKVLAVLKLDGDEVSVTPDLVDGEPQQAARYLWEAVHMLLVEEDPTYPGSQ